MPDISCDVLVVGGGPGGYVCAIRAGQLGLKTVLVEREALGGTCLNVGCIPSKALIHVADEFHNMVEATEGSETGLSCSGPKVDFARTIAWKDGIVSRLTGGVGSLLKRAGVTVLSGNAVFLDGKTIEIEVDDGKQRVAVRNTVIATGSTPVEVPGLAVGGRILGSTEALALQEVPKRLVVVGAGYIGLEMGTAFSKLGTQVEIIEAGKTILPLYDKAIVAPVAARLKALGVSVRTEAKVTSVSEDGTVALEDGTEIRSDYVLVTVGRTANTAGFGLEDLELKMSGRYIAIDDRCQTSMTGVYAIGDVTGEPLLAHRAMVQGEMVAEILAGENRRWDSKVIPAVCFTDPEIVSVGLSPADAIAAGINIVEAQFPFVANGRAMTLERDDGFIRIVARADDHAVIGFQAVGAGIAELASVFVTSMEMGALLEDVAGIVQAHPTQGEGFQEAAMKALGHALHV